MEKGFISDRLELFFSVNFAGTLIEVGVDGFEGVRVFFLGLDFVFAFLGVFKEVFLFPMPFGKDVVHKE